MPELPSIAAAAGTARLRGSRAIAVTALTTVLATIAAACGAATVLAVRSVEARDLHWRLVAADQPTWDALGRDRPLRPYRDLEYFRSELARAGIDTGRKDGPTAVAVLRYMLNEVRAVGTATPPTARAALEHARRGGGLTCGPLALLYSHLLVAAGYRARMVQLARSQFDGLDTHVVVEALIDDRWVLLDSTFNVHFERNGRWLGAAELATAQRDGSLDRMTIHQHGEVAFPARLQTYYLDWRTLYSHVLVLDEDRAGRFRRLPIMRYLNGPRWYYLAPRAGHELGLVQGARWSQWVAFMALPVCSLTAAGLLLVLLASGKRNRGC